MDADLDPSLDLRFERLVAPAPEQIWRAWTDPESLVRWFSPPPWRTTEAQVDLRPGGTFRTVMEGPDGEREDAGGSFLVVEKPGLLVWTNLLGPGFRPQAIRAPGFAFTASLELEAQESGTLYRATLRHGSAQDALAHAAMGFEEGWGAALDQLVALC